MMNVWLIGKKECLPFVQLPREPRVMRQSWQKCHFLLQVISEKDPGKNYKTKDEWHSKMSTDFLLLHFPKSNP